MFCCRCCRCFLCLLYRRGSGMSKVCHAWYDVEFYDIVIYTMSAFACARNTTAENIAVLEITWNVSLVPTTCQSQILQIPYDFHWFSQTKKPSIKAGDRLAKMGTVFRIPFSVLSWIVRCVKFCHIRLRVAKYSGVLATEIKTFLILSEISAENRLAIDSHKRMAGMNGGKSKWGSVVVIDKPIRGPPFDSTSSSYWKKIVLSQLSTYPKADHIFPTSQFAYASGYSTVLK